MKIMRLSQRLVREICYWGAIEDLLRPPELGGWSRPTTRIIPFNVEGKWRKADIDGIKRVLKAVIDEFNMSRKKMWGEVGKPGFHPAMNALFNQTRFKLHGLFSLIYSEFPLPPRGIEDLKIENVKNSAYFENKISLLTRWKEYFDDYFDTVIDAYYSLRYILCELNKIESRSLKTLFNQLMDYSKAKKHIASFNYLGEAGETYRKYVEYEQAVRETFFNGIVEIKRITDEIEDSIEFYNRYKEALKPSLLFYFFIFTAFTTGTLIPVILQLFSEIKVILNTTLVAFLFISSLTSIFAAIVSILQRYECL